MESDFRAAQQGAGRHSFNSATALKPWRAEQKPVTSGPKHPLQFGHGVEAVESFMDVPILIHGHKLQFGHGVEAVES